MSLPVDPPLTEEEFKKLAAGLPAIHTSIDSRVNQIKDGLTRGNYLVSRQRELDLLKEEKLHRTIMEAAKTRERKKEILRRTICQSVNPSEE